MTNQLTGLELRRAVSEKLMGVKVRHHGGGARGVVLTDLIIPGGVNQIDFVGRLTVHDLLGALPPWERDTTAMWQVVDKMRELGFTFVLGNGMTHRDDQPDWLAQVCRIGGVDVIAEAICPTVSEAICLAALAAVAHKYPTRFDTRKLDARGMTG